MRTMGPRTSRRTVLQWGAAGAAATVAGVLDVSTGPWQALARAAAPQKGSGRVVLTLSPWAALWNPAVQGILYDATAPFRAAHPSVEIRLVPPVGGNPPINITALLAGS